MALKTPTTPLVISLTQGSADAFVQGSVLTGITGNVAYNVKAIYVEFPNAGALAAAMGSDEDLQVAITRRSKTSMPNVSDTDVIHKYSLVAGTVTSGSFVFEATNIYVPQLDIPIVEETIYAQLDSTATGLSNLAIVRMEVEVDSMSAIDRLNLITRSLT